MLFWTHYPYTKHDVKNFFENIIQGIGLNLTDWS